MYAEYTFSLGRDLAQLAEVGARSGLRETGAQGPILCGYCVGVSFLWWMQAMMDVKRKVS